MNSGQTLWIKSKELIPGGNSLISKRPDLFAPNLWPTYYDKAKGYFIWDLENRKYVDMSIMGIGTNTLGYGNENIDEAVIRAVKNGNMCSLNCPEEVQLAEKLIEIHPWAGMARFARGGGEANAISIRIARAFSKREKVAFCGYHGWHDWYMAAGKKESALANHLFKDIKTEGIPDSLKGTSIPFEWNNLSSLNKVLEENKGEIGTIKMEVTRNILPSFEFLSSVRKLCDEQGIVLIFDECTSGFRETYGGIHLKYNVFPDIAVFGKALGNGYAISAVLGRKDIMKSAKDSFISSTFWTERIGYVAALETLREMERIKSWERITELGTSVQRRWESLAKRNKVKIEVGVLPPIATFNFISKNAIEYKTYMTREFLKIGYLASNLFFVSTAHMSLDFNEYFEKIDEIFKAIYAREVGEIKEPLVPENELCGSSFQRLN
ncbi:aminotransferase class III-fold pyridoxal phosphate-dependent enzyme [Prochlorococcus sp. MIT 1223]|uniref:aminotransferase class III-fold pyridoxal phosphate-dependent enzyme n=1 Tax=Prochlorococcus sp. MIT 1223 TaxID=3096217 RepID=UPI002A756D54|nr:aminotransferase class III-fold pyridoxal phosphate-dependent enzyme [Prochlorococcus sp. MIT 1223]